MNEYSFVDEKLQLIEQNLLKRELKTVVTASGPWVQLEGGKRVLQFASNNFLGLSNHPEVISAAVAAAKMFGVGSTGSRLLSGNYGLHIKLENALAEFEGSEAGIFFSSGYSANVGVLSALLDKNDAVYSDEFNHASIIDGIRLSGASKFIYNHNDMVHLESLLKENSPRFAKNMIVTDTVFSMEADVAPLADIARVAEKYNCLTVVDEAHATGVFGKTCSGLVEELNLSKYFPIKTVTCSKALAIEGGFCSAPKNVIEYLRHTARSFMFSTSSSPVIVGALLKALELLKDSSWRKEKLWENAALLHKGLKRNYKLKISDLKSPIICVYFNSISEALNFSDKLLNECHIWAPAIRPPSVKTARIRLTPISTHSADDINYVIKAFDYLSKDLKVEPLPLVYG